MKASVDSSIKDMSEGVDVNLEILSNWGDPRRVGLTEVSRQSVSPSMLEIFRF